MFAVAPAPPRDWSSDQIKALRKRLRASQELFAEWLGYSRRQSVGELESGEITPSGSVRKLLDIIDAHDGLPEADA
ncbi:MAG: hypothetical protein AAF845_05605 [Bacteroidota bacterium]